MNITTTSQISTLYPEITFEYRKFSHGRSIKWIEATTASREKIAEIVAANDSLAKAQADVPDDPAAIAKVKTLTDKYHLILARDVDTAYIRVYLKSVKGFDVDEKAASVDDFIEEAPSDLFNEAVEYIKAQSSLSDAERKN